VNLDLENPSAFWRIIRDDADGAAAALKTCRDNTGLLDQLSEPETIPEDLRDAVARFVTEADNQVSSVTAYHGCRVTKERDYTDKGIVILETEQLLSRARQIFGNSRELQKVVEELEYYTSRREKAVFCLRRIEATRKVRSKHHDGSELIRRIGEALGDTAVEKYHSTGKPCHIEIQVPRDWFDHHARPAIRLLLQGLYADWVRYELKLDGWSNNGVVFGESIPPEFIKTFLYVTGSEQP